MSWFSRIFGSRKKARKPVQNTRNRVNRNRNTTRSRNNNRGRSIYPNNVEPGDPMNLENNNNNYRRKGNAIYASVYRGGKKTRRR